MNWHALGQSQGSHITMYYGLTLDLRSSFKNITSRDIVPFKRDLAKCDTVFSFSCYKIQFDKGRKMFLYLPSHNRYRGNTLTTKLI